MLEVHIPRRCRQALKRVGKKFRRVVDQRRQRPEFAGDIGDEARQRIVVGEVCRKDIGRAAATGDFVGQFLGLDQGLTVVDGDAPACLRQIERDGAADAARRTSDQYRFSCRSDSVHGTWSWD